MLDLWRAADAIPTTTDRHDALGALLAADPDALLVAECDGAVVGTLIAGWNGWRGSFYRLAVHPAHRRRGIATALVREGERRLRDRGAHRLDAILVSGEDDAFAFWQAAGYERQLDRSRFVRNL